MCGALPQYRLISVAAVTHAYKLIKVAVCTYHQWLVVTRNYQVSVYSFLARIARPNLPYPGISVI